jgi:hypothetical protein
VVGWIRELVLELAVLMMMPSFARCIGSFMYLQCWTVSAKDLSTFLPADARDIVGAELDFSMPPGAGLRMLMEW